jgi:hypothetical protein
MMDDEESGLGIKKTNEDKLVYRLEIQDAIKTCRKSRSEIPGMKYAVDGLISIIEFDIQGYHFKRQIDTIKLNLEMERKIRLLRFLRRNGLRSSNPLKIHIFKLNDFEWYYSSLFQQVLQMLAKENMLIETEKIIRIHDST